MHNALLHGVRSRGGASRTRHVPARPQPPGAGRAAATAASPRSLLDIFDATVAGFGARTAIEADDAALSYEECAAAARALGARLHELGVGPGDRVGVHVPSGSAELYLAILGVLHSGAAYVPVDADDPPARAAVVWERAEVCAVIGEGLRIESLAAPRGRTGPVSPDDDAWIIFTSGSTGAPKGVAVSHRIGGRVRRRRGRALRRRP